MTAITKPQAAKVWCPMVRPSVNGQPEGGSGCIADACAMWRWLDHHGGRYLSETPEAYNDTRRRGYCGLAGKPAAEE